MPWTWTHSTVIAGSTFDVTVTDSPCQPVTVKLTISGQSPVVQKITSPPGTVTFSVPAGSQGQTYRIDVICGGDADTRNGSVA
jgi:hypothetical protein